MKINTLSVTRNFLDERVFVTSQCNVHLFQHTSVQYGANPCSTLPTGNKVRFLHGDLKIAKKKKVLGPRPWCEAAPQESGFSERPTTTAHTGVPESVACGHDEASWRWKQGRR